MAAARQPAFGVNGPETKDVHESGHRNPDVRVAAPPKGFRQRDRHVRPHHPAEQSRRAAAPAHVFAEGSRHRADHRAGRRRARHLRPSRREGAGHRLALPQPQHRHHRRRRVQPGAAAHGAAGPGQAVEGDRPCRLRRHPQPGPGARQRHGLRLHRVPRRRRGHRRRRLSAEGRLRPGQAHAQGRAYLGEDRLLPELRGLVPVEKPG